MIYYDLNLLSKLENQYFTAVYYDFNNNLNQNCMSPPVNDTMHQGGERQKILIFKFLDPLLRGTYTLLGLFNRGCRHFEW